MREAVKRILVFGWSLVVACVVFLLIIQKPAKLPPWFPDWQAFHAFIILLMLLSVAYGIGRLYRQGMKHARKK
jgi:hypothetical protein